MSNTRFRTTGSTSPNAAAPSGGTEPNRWRCFSTRHSANAHLRQSATIRAVPMSHRSSADIRDERRGIDRVIWKRGACENAGTLAIRSLIGFAVRPAQTLQT
jgi:hypothetical protein